MADDHKNLLNDLPLPNEPAKTSSEGRENNAIASNDELCSVCGRKNDNNRYGNGCRTQKAGIRFGVFPFILAFIILLTSAAGYFVAVTTAKASQKLFAAEQCIREKQFENSLSLYYGALDEANTLNRIILNHNFDIPYQKLFIDKEKATQVILEIYIHRRADHYFDSAPLLESVRKYRIAHCNSTEVAEIYDTVRQFDAFSKRLYKNVNDSIHYVDSFDPDILGSDDIYEVDYEKITEYLNSIEPQNAAQESLVDYYRLVVENYCSSFNNSDIINDIENVSFCKFCNTD